jgi:hypothetical protein
MAPRRRRKAARVRQLVTDTAESASDSDEEWSGSDRVEEEHADDWDEEPTTAARPRKAARCAGQAAVRGPGAGEQTAAGPADAPRGRRDEAAWEGSFARLAAYKDAHGHCSVPKGWAEDSRLGSWVSKQRARKKALDRGEPSQGMTAARVARLEALGFIWALSREQISKRKGQAARTDEAAWEEKLERLAAYKQEHGDCSVPRGWAEDPPLGRWVGHQRTNKKALDRGDPSQGMTAARAAKLEALGFAYDTPDAAWEEKLARLAAYKQEHGDCSVPRGWAEDPQLGRWVDNQRARKKALDRGEPSPGMTAARAAKLEALGFAWKLPAAVRGNQISKGTRDDAGWQSWLAKLKQHKRKHGDCNVPRGWAEDPQLGRWVDTQRALKKKLDRDKPSEGMTAARAAMLDKLGFNWAPPRGGGRGAARR